MASTIALIAPALAVGSWFYGPLKESFLEQGWDVEVLPRRGFEAHQPKAKPGHDWSYADEAQVIVDAIARARAEDPNRQIVIVGHSLGGQLGAAVQLGDQPADGLVTIGTSAPHYRLYGFRAVGLLTMALAVRPAARIAGYLHKPFFGAPGPKTMMTEWADMIITGEMPYDLSEKIARPALSVHLEGDSFSVYHAVREFEIKNFEADSLTRWTYRKEAVPEGGNTHHVQWVRKPEPVVEFIVDWWATQSTPLAED